MANIAEEANLQDPQDRQQQIAEVVERLKVLAAGRGPVGNYNLQGVVAPGGYDPMEDDPMEDDPMDVEEEVEDENGGGKNYPSP